MAEPLLLAHQQVLQHLRLRQYDRALAAVQAALERCPSSELDAQLEAVLRELAAARISGAGSDSGGSSEGEEGQAGEEASSGSGGEGSGDDSDDSDSSGASGEESDASKQEGGPEQEEGGASGMSADGAGARGSASGRGASSGSSSSMDEGVGPPDLQQAPASGYGEAQRAPGAQLLLDPASYSMSRGQRAQLRKQLADSIRALREAEHIKALVARDPLLLA